MSWLSVEELVLPLSELAPAGDNLEYDGKYLAFEELTKGTPERVVRVVNPDNPSEEMDRVIPGEDADPKSVLDLGLALFKRTRDLRVAVAMVGALTRIGGLAGLAEGLSLIAGLLEQMWESVHPQLDEEDDFDPFMRANALQLLADSSAVMRVVRASPFIESRAVGRFTIRDIEVARGERSPLADQATATLDLLGAVLQDAGEDYRNLRLQEAHLVVEGIDRIRKAFRSHASGSEPDLDDLQSIVKKAIEVLAGQAKAESVNPQVTDQEPGAPRASGGGSGQLANRADAKKALNAIADFLERIEPAHPAPLFIRRAANLIDMNFMEIMKNMAPSSLDGIRHLGGLEDDN